MVFPSLWLQSRLSRSSGLAYWAAPSPSYHVQTHPCMESVDMARQYDLVTNSLAPLLLGAQPRAMNKPRDTQLCYAMYT